MKYIFLISCFTFLGCSYENSNESVYQRNEKDVINDLFSQLVISDIAYLRGIDELGPPPVPSLFKTNSKENIAWEKSFDKFNKRLTKENLDTVSLPVYLPDSLLQYRGEKILHKSPKLSNLHGEDSLKVYLILKLQDSLQSIKFDFNGLTQKGNIKILPFSLYRESKLKIKAQYVFSRIAFDSKFQNGCFSFTISCGGLCGGETLYFIKKIKGKWVIINEESLWVS